MTETPFARRDLLRLVVAGAALGLATPGSARGIPDRQKIRVASNQGVENATLQELLRCQGFAERYALDVELVEGHDIADPMQAVISGRADVCMISAYAGLLPAIASGSPLRLVGAAMERPAIAVYTGKADIRSVRDLVGRTVGIGDENALLHLLMIAVLRRHGVDPSEVNFVRIGGNTEVFRAVREARVDAGPSGVAATPGEEVRALADGRLWRELPDFLYQPAFASLDAIRQRPEALARCLAAYTDLYRYVSSTRSHDAYLDARTAVGGDRGGGEQVWRFAQDNRPYAEAPAITRRQTDFVQRLNVSVGLQARVVPFSDLVDLRPLRRARSLTVAHP